jgi:phosphatidylglycerol:prolipoprotein diacylglycerol transferase
MLGYLVHDIDPFVIKFDEWMCIEGIRWYGVCYAISFLIALLLMNVYSDYERSDLSREQNISFLSYAIVGVVVGGRLGYMLMYNLAEFTANPLTTFAIWRGGMASHGGFMGIVVAILLFRRRNKIDMFALGDVCASIAPIGLLLGRLANFLNGELYGKITSVPWAVIFPQSDLQTLKISEIVPRHPSQLYECFAEGFLLTIYVQLRFWFSKDLAKGQLAGEFLMGYAVARVAMEVYREVDAPMIFGLSRGQFYSIFLFIAGFALTTFARHRYRRQNFY